MPTALALPGWGTSPQRLRPICAALDEHGIDARPHGYEPTGTIESLGASLARVAAGEPGPLHLVGHSLGGLVVASAVLHHGVEPATVTTVNAPWRGTWAAWTAQPGDALGHDLRWHADALQDLRERLGHHLEQDGGPVWNVLSAAGDLAVPITGSTRVPTGQRLTTRIVPVTGHSVSLLHERMVDAVVDGVVGVRA